MRGTYGSVPGASFWIIIGSQWLIWAAVACTWPQKQVLLGSSITPVLHAVHISVRITRTGHVGSVFHQSTHFSFPTHSYHPPCLRSQTMHHTEYITVPVYCALAWCWWQIEFSCWVLHFTSFPLFPSPQCCKPSHQTGSNCCAGGCCQCLQDISLRYSAGQHDRQHMSHSVLCMEVATACRWIGPHNLVENYEAYHTWVCTDFNWFLCMSVV